jgi:hypothetical protein
MDIKLKMAVVYLDKGVFLGGDIYGLEVFWNILK